MNFTTGNVSDRWLRTNAYERGKEGDAHTTPVSHRHLRLAEARATLREGWREWPTDDGVWGATAAMSR